MQWESALLAGQLTQANIEKFADRLKPKSCFTVPQNMTHDDVMVWSRAQGLEVAYCEAGSAYYEQYGPRTYIVIQEDLSAHIAQAEQTLIERPHDCICVKRARLSGTYITSAKQVVYQSKPRTSVLSLKIVNRMITQGRLEVVKRVEKARHFDICYQLKGASELVLEQSHDEY